MNHWIILYAFINANLQLFSEISIDQTTNAESFKEILIPLAAAVPYDRQVSMNLLDTILSDEMNTTKLPCLF